MILIVAIRSNYSHEDSIIRSQHSQKIHIYKIKNEYQCKQISYWIPINYIKGKCN